MGHLSWITYPLTPLINVGRCQQNGEKNHPIMNIVDEGRGEHAFCPIFFLSGIDRFLINRKLRNVRNLEKCYGNVLE